MSAEDESLKANEAQAEQVETTEELSAEAAQVEQASADNAEADEQTAAKDWQQEAQALAEQIGAYKDQAVRAQAEMQNIRRRAEMDVEKAHKFALEKFAKELLPVIDSMEKAIEAEKESGAEATPLREGVEMTLSMFLSGIKKFNLEQVDPVGQPFDPALHEAMSMVPAPDAEPNTVIAAMQKGYTLSGRLIRPAMVVVSK